MGQGACQTLRQVAIALDPGANGWRVGGMHRADARRLEEARSARRGLIRYVFLLSLGMLALLLWYMNRYSETRDALQAVCAFIAREVSAKIKEDAAETPVESLKQVHGICDEKVAFHPTLDRA